jgi:hypothetical protein
MATLKKGNCQFSPVTVLNFIHFYSYVRFIFGSFPSASALKRFDFNDSKERRIKQKYQIPVERMTLTACLRSITILKNYPGFFYRMIHLPAGKENMHLPFPISLNLINLLTIFDPATSLNAIFFSLLSFCKIHWLSNLKGNQPVSA